MNRTEPPPLWKRLTWFVGLWAVGVVTVAVVAYGLRWWLGQSING